jgi:hypothetical protein
MRKNAPGDPSQFIGQRNCENVAVQPLFGRFNPGPEPVALPALRLDQHHPRRLHKQYPQVAVIGPFISQSTSAHLLGTNHLSKVALSY